MTTRRVTSHEVSVKDEPLARVHLVATLVDPDYLLPMRNFFSGRSIQPDERATAVSDEDGMMSVELVRNDEMRLDSRYLIETWIERDDGTRTPRRAHVIYIDDGDGDLSLDDLSPSTPHTPPETPLTPSTPVTPVTPTTVTIYAAVREPDSAFTATDFTGADGVSTMSGEWTLPTWTGGNRYYAIAQPITESEFTEIRVTASMFNDLPSFNVQASTIMISGVECRIYLFDDQLLPASSGLDWTAS